MPIGFLNRLKIGGADSPSKLGTPARPSTGDADDPVAFLALTSKVDAMNARGEHAEALALVDEAGGRPTTSLQRAELMLARGTTLKAWGRAHEAIAALTQAHKLGCIRPNIPALLGGLYRGIGNLDEALAWMDNAIAAEPMSQDAWLGRAAVLALRRDFSGAASMCQRALALAPLSVEAHSLLGDSLIGLGRPADAESSYRRGIEIEPGRTTTWSNLAMALAQQGRHAEALEAGKTAARLDTLSANPAGSYVNLGIELRDDGQCTEAIALYERRLLDAPCPAGYRDYAHALLTAGRLAEAWPNFEFRWMLDPLLSLRGNPGCPPWIGQDVRGKIVLIRAEQGLGDTIQFSRYAPLLVELGANVFMSVQSGLEDLIRSIAGVSGIAGGAKLPAIDYYVSAMSLPGVFGTTVDTIPATVPYVRADAEKVARWEKRLAGDGRPRIGLTWVGRQDHLRDQERSLSVAVLRSLAQILKTREVRLISLQAGPLPSACSGVVQDFDIEYFGDELIQFDDTAALIANLDLVLSVDTAVAHLAGAMAKPVWLMLPKPADWRWMETRNDSPWYPTMRIFRQSRRGDWDGVVRSVGAALQSDPLDRATRALSMVPQAPAPRDQPNPKHGGRGVCRDDFAGVADTREGLLQFMRNDDVGRSLANYGEYLHEHLEWLAHLIPVGAHIVETDAGVGAHTVPLARGIGPTGVLLAYEPSPVQSRLLRQNLIANRISNVSVLSRFTDRRDGAGVATAPKLDDLRLGQLHLLKMGIGDDHRAILLGGTQTIWERRPVLFACAANEAALAGSMKFVKEFGYRAWQRVTPLFPVHNFYCSTSDVFGGRSSYAWIGIPEEIHPPVDDSTWVEV